MCEANDVLCIRQHYMGAETMSRRKSPLATREGNKHEKSSGESRKMTRETISKLA